MYIKLHFDNTISLDRCFQLLDHILRNSSANSTNLMSGAEAYFTSNVGYNSSLSEIIRTVEPSNINTYWGPNTIYNTNDVNSAHRFVMQMSSYDDTSQKYMIQYCNDLTTILQ